MTSFSEICESSGKWEFWRTQTGTLERKMLNQLSCLERYVLMIRDAVFPNILLASPDNKAVRAIVRDALKQLEDM